MPGVPLLEALQGVGVVGAGVPIHSNSIVKLNIYVRAHPLIFPATLGLKRVCFVTSPCYLSVAAVWPGRLRRVVR